MSLPSHYSLVQEHPQSYEIHDSRDDSRFHVAKSGVNLAMHAKLAGIPKYADGGEIPISLDPNTAQVPDSAETPAFAPPPPAPPGTDLSPIGLLDPTQAQPVAPPSNEIQYPVEPSPATTGEDPNGLKLASTGPTPWGLLDPDKSNPAATAPESKTPDADQKTDPTSRDTNSFSDAIIKGAQAEALAGQQTAKAYQKYAQDLQSGPSADQIFRSHQARDQELQNAYMSKDIDPNRYWANKGTAGTIAAGLGMVLGGIGAGIGGGSNPAVDAINKAIDRDIDSQRSDQSKAMNLWKMNREATKDEADAHLATQNQMYGAVKAQAMQYAAQAAGPEAKARVAPLLMQLNQQMQVNNWMRSLRTASTAGSEQDFINNMKIAEQVKPDYYKDMQGKYIPNVGVARTPVTEADRKALTGYDSLGGAIQDAIKFQTNDAGTLGTFPGSSANAVANSKRSAIILELNTLHGLNRLNDNEFNSYIKSVPDVGSFFSSRSLSQLGELNQQLQIHKAAEMKNLGITPFQGAGSQSMGASMGQPQGTQTFRGKQYVQQGRYMVPVGQ